MSTKGARRELVWPSGKALSPFLTGPTFASPNMVRCIRRTLLRFLIELIVRRIWFGLFDELILRS